MKSVTVKQIQRLDRLAIEKYGVPSIVLMENAGTAVAHEALRQIKKIRNPQVAVICGLGNNAGDGFVVARHLLNAGIKTKIFLIGTARKLKNDAAVNYGILKRLAYPFKYVGAHGDSLLRDVLKSDIIVDAIFGVGLNREIKEPFRQVIETINHSSKKIISVDIPSGLDGTTGRIYGVCLNARTTVTFSFAKKGFFKNEGPKHTGKIVVADIGIPERLKRRI